MPEWLTNLWNSVEVQVAFYMIVGSFVTWLSDKLIAKGGIFASVGSFVKKIADWLIGNRGHAPTPPK